MEEKNNNPIGAKDDGVREDVTKTALEFEFFEEIGGERSENTVSDEEAPVPVVEDSSSVIPELTIESETMTESDADMPFDDLTSMRTTYVPKFTEVSDTYKMKGSAQADSVSVRVERAEGSALRVGASLDATAEFEDDTIERVIVTSATSGTSEPTDESIKLYKFDNERTAVPKIPSAVNMKPKTEEVAVDADVPAPEKDEKETREYSIPDPEKVGEDGEDVAKRYSAAEMPSGLYDRGNAKSRGYSYYTQRDAVKDKFLDSLMAIRIRLVAICILFLGLIAIEILNGMGYTRMFAFNINEFTGETYGRGIYYVRPIVDVLLCLCMFLLALPELIRAFRQLFSRGRIMPEFFMLLELPLMAYYSYYVIWERIAVYLNLSLLYAVQVLFVVYGAYCRKRADFDAFKIVSAGNVKNVLDIKLTRELPRENMALDGAVDEYKSYTARNFRTAFVSDFDYNCNQVARRGARNRNAAIIYAMTIGVALITAILANTYYKGAFEFYLASFGMVLFAAFPAFSVLSHQLPYMHVNHVAKNAGGIFIGEAALSDGEKINVVTYQDTDVFGQEDVTIRKVNLYGKAFNTHKAMRQMYAIFSAVGGPLKELFGSSLDRKCESATEITIENGGISGMFEGHRICAGTEEYMRRNNIVIPEDDGKAKNAPTDSTKIMYGAEDGEVYVKFSIRYSFSEEFTMMLPHLAANNIVSLIYTSDPNINDDLINILTGGGAARVRVLLKDSLKAVTDQTFRRLSASIVNNEKNHDNLGMILLAKKYTRFQKRLAIIELIAQALGMGVGILFSFIGLFNSYTVVGLLAWQLGCGVALYGVSRYWFRRKKHW